MVLKYIDRASLLTTGLIVIWLLTPSSLFLRIVAIEYIGDAAILHREVPFGEVKANWTSEARVEGSDLECTSSGTAVYQHEPDGTVTFQQGAWIAACTDLGRPYVIVNTWRVLLFGVIPLRPIERVTVPQ